MTRWRSVASVSVQALLALNAAALLLVALLLLADCQAHYFDFIERTGGRAHPTFRTAAVEPKLAALQLVGRHRQPGATWIVTSEYWNELPLRYLAWHEPDLCIVTPEKVGRRSVSPVADRRLRRAAGALGAARHGAEKGDRHRGGNAN